MLKSNLKSRSIFSTKSTNKTNTFGKFISNIMFYMFIGIAISTFSAFLFLHSPLMHLVFQIKSGSIIGLKSSYYLFIFAPLAISLIHKFFIHNQTDELDLAFLAKLELALFVIYSFVMGLTLSIIFIIYTNESIFMTFLSSMIAFLTMSFYAQRTSSNLLRYSGLINMLLIGMIVSGLVNAFIFQSIGFDFLLSIAGVVIFSFIIAYNMQFAKHFYLSGKTNSYIQIKLAFIFYLSFMQIFFHLIRLIGKRR